MRLCVCVCVCVSAYVYKRIYPCLFTYICIEREREMIPRPQFKMTSCNVSHIVLRSRPHFNLILHSSACSVQCSVPRNITPYMLILNLHIINHKCLSKHDLILLTVRTHARIMAAVSPAMNGNAWAESNYISLELF